MQFTNLTNRLRLALKEDAAFSDATTLQIPSSFRMKRITAQVVAKETGILCGAFLLAPVFRLLDKNAQIQVKAKDGKRVRPKQVLAALKLKASALFAGERVFLNLATHLSGIATLTKAYVDAVKGTPAVILDTRKTTPLWRDLERYAVRCGGGRNHRATLKDAVLVKDNHLQFIRNLGLPIKEVFNKTLLTRWGIAKRLSFFEMEAADYQDVWEGIKARADIILLDNMPVKRIQGAITFIKAARTALSSDKPLIEVSGGITPQIAKRLASLGVDRISVGALTHSAPALDLSMEVT